MTGSCGEMGGMMVSVVAYGLVAFALMAIGLVTLVRWVVDRAVSSAR